jgi:hypothetical protein
MSPFLAVHGMEAEGVVGRGVVSPLDTLFGDGVVPDALRGVLLDFRWELDRLLALDLPLEEIRVEDYRWLLDLPFWREKGELFVVTPNQVRDRPGKHLEQWARALTADLDSPVHITERHCQMVILDGIHRLLKADIFGRDTIPARRVPASALPLIATAR